MKHLLSLIVAALAIVPAAWAGEVVTSHVEHNGAHYLVNIDMRVNARRDKILALITDYAHLGRVNSAIKESRVLSHDGPHYRVRIVTRGCVLFFCKRVVHVQVVTELVNGYVVARLDPAASDFEYGTIVWRVWHDDLGTRVNFSADLVPAFWVPPLIGPWALKHKLIEEGQQTINGLERLARR